MWVEQATMSESGVFESSVLCPHVSNILAFCTGEESETFVRIDDLGVPSIFDYYELAVCAQIVRRF